MRRATTLAVTGLVALALLVACTDRGPDLPEVAALLPDGVEPTFVLDPSCFDVQLGLLRPADVRCGTVAVPARYGDPAAGTIDLAVVALGGADVDRSPVPLAVLHGGPGASIVRAVLEDPVTRGAFAVGPVTIALDQRGSGLSGPELRCDPPDPLAQLDPAAASEAAAACRDELTRAGVAIDALDVRSIARDVSVVRLALGVDELDLLGTSFGTHVALLVAEEDPAIRALVLDAPVDPTLGHLHQWASATAAVPDVLDGLEQRCAADPGCAATSVGVVEPLVRLGARLAEAPEPVEVRVPGEPARTIDVTPQLLGTTVALALREPSSAAALPALVRAADEGTLAPLVQTGVDGALGLSVAIDVAPSLGVRCALPAGADEAQAVVDGIEVASLRAAAQRDLDVWAERCAGWRAAAGAGGDDADVDASAGGSPSVPDAWPDVPALVLSGGLDAVTPPAWATSVHERLPGSHLVEVSDAGHTPFGQLDACGRSLVHGFLAAPDRAPDASCADGLRLPVRSGRW